MKQYAHYIGKGIRYNLTSCGQIHDPRIHDPRTAYQTFLIILFIGPFSPCFVEVDPQPFFKDCSYDACAAENATEIMCEHFERYASVCREAGVAINGWRNTHTECGMI